jgi:hypothetical protein
VIDLAAAIEQYLEPAEPGVLVELDRDDDAVALAAEVRAAVLAAEVRAARAVAARFVGRGDLDETDVAERLADAIDAYDHATSVPPTSGGGHW